MPQQLEVIQKLTAHRGKVWCASWHPLGKSLAIKGAVNLKSYLKF